MAHLAPLRLLAALLVAAVACAAHASRRVGHYGNGADVPGATTHTFFHRILDADGDGFVTVDAEFGRLARALEGDDRRARVSRDAMTKQWDGDGDGRLSEAEYYRYVAGSLPRVTNFVTAPTAPTEVRIMNSGSLNMFVMWVTGVQTTGSVVEFGTSASSLPLQGSGVQYTCACRALLRAAARCSARACCVLPAPVTHTPWPLPYRSRR